MTTTQTKRGITAKSILGEFRHTKELTAVEFALSPTAGLKSGHLVAFPKNYLDPRRDVEHTDEMKSVRLFLQLYRMY